MAGRWGTGGGRVAHPHPAVHRQGRGGQDHRVGRHRAALRRRRPAHAGPVDRSGPLARPTPSTSRSAPWSRPWPTGLWGQQLDAQDRMEDAWAEIQRYLLEVFRWAGVEAIEAEELSVVPGLDEVFALSDIKPARHHRRLGRRRRRLRADGRDHPPAVAARRARPVHGAAVPRRAGGSTRSCRRCSPGSPACRSRATTCSPPPSGSTTGSTACASCSPTAAAPACAWSSTPSAWSSPRPAAPTPTCRCSATTSTRSSPTGCCPTTSPTRGSPGGRRRTPSTSPTIEAGFAPVPVLRVPLQPDELVGPAALRAFADALYGDEDPTARFGAARAAARAAAGGETMVLELELPFADRDDLELGRDRRRAAGAGRALPAGDGAARLAARGARCSAAPRLQRRPPGGSTFGRPESARRDAGPRGRRRQGAASHGHDGSERRHGGQRQREATIGPAAPATRRRPARRAGRRRGACPARGSSTCRPRPAS